MTDNLFEPPHVQTDPPVAPTQPARIRRRLSLYAGIILAALYGIAAYSWMNKLDSLPTVSAVFLLPIAVAAVPYLFSDEAQIRNFTFWIIAPWLSCLAFLLLIFLVLGEAGICLSVFIVPAMLVALLVTTIIWLTRAISLRISRRKRMAAGIALMLLPLVGGAIEHRWLITQRSGRVESRTIVHAPIAHVWQHLAVVETISAAEFRPGLLHAIGVPRPLRATVDRLGEGGRRTGQFEDGLRFDEIITTWQPPRVMAFSVDVDPSILRPGSAERHAFENGYFRFTDATYRLTPLQDGTVELSLTSRYVLKSGVNGYGQLWANAVIGDFQERVLDVLRRRSEAVGRPSPGIQFGLPEPTPSGARPQLVAL